MAWSGCDLYSGNIKYYCSYYQFDQIQVHLYVTYTIFTIHYNTIQFNVVSFQHRTQLHYSDRRSGMSKYVLL